MGTEQQNVNPRLCGQSLLIKALRVKTTEVWKQDSTFSTVIAYYDHRNQPVAQGFRSERQFNHYVDEHGIDLIDINVVVETSPPQALAG